MPARSRAASLARIDASRLSHALATHAPRLVRAIGRAQAAGYRRVGGGPFGRYVNGRPVLVLTTRGRRSGHPRRTSLVYMREGDAYVVVPSNAGLDRDPAWVLNLRADPSAEVQVGRRRLAVRAREPEGDEAEALWERAARHNPDWGLYRRYTDRPYGPVLLEPAPE